MRPCLVLIISFIFLTAGCAYGSDSSFAFSPSEQSTPQSGLLVAASDQNPKQSEIEKVDSIKDEYKEDENLDYAEDTFKEERLEIADPLEPINRAIHQVNDKLYFWALKPVAQGYKAVVPEPARVSVKNFFDNLRFPSHFLNCLLQADLNGAATEVARFSINTIWGMGGLLDPASSKELNLQSQDTDLGETLGMYGLGQGFYFVWPVLGPSSLRDSISYVSDYFLYPVSYISPWYAWLGVRTYQEVNDTSLRIGDYEALKDAAIDPYVAFRDAYVQYRFKRVKARKAKFTSLSAPLAESSPPAQTEFPEKGN